MRIPTEPKGMWILAAVYLLSGVGFGLYDAVAECIVCSVIGVVIIGAIFFINEGSGDADIKQERDELRAEVERLTQERNHWMDEARIRLAKIEDLTGTKGSLPAMRINTEQEAK